MTDAVIERSAPVAGRNARIVERNKRIIDLDAEGLSAAEIAYEIGACLTRNAVLGVLFRDRKERGVPPTAAAARIGRRQTPARPVAVAPPARPVAVLGTPLCVSIEDLQADMCKWPYGPAGGYQFCGQLKTHHAYCPAHRRMAYAKAQTPA